VVALLVREDDGAADALVHELQSRGTRVFRVDLGWFPQRLTLDARIDDGGLWRGRLATAHHHVDLEDITAIWYRQGRAFDFPAALSPPHRSYAHVEARLGLGGGLATPDVVWAKHPNRSADAHMKPLQLSLARAAGLQIKPTLVTNVPDSAAAFAAEFGAGGAITKSFATDPGEYPTVYSDKTLVTAYAGPQPLSSSTMPGLMLRMLESLDVRDGHRVLEIGTGTGYNAALLSHRVGDAHVVSADVETDLVNQARGRLAAIGYRPLLLATDGLLGAPGHGPFDRIISTCAVRRIPPAWIQQTTPGGNILTDLKISRSAGSLVRLVTTSDGTAEGRFDPAFASFMNARPAPGVRDPHFRPTRDRAGARTTVTALNSPTPWTAQIPWFLACMSLGEHVEYGFAVADADQPPTAAWLATPDGSWAEIPLAADNSGSRDVLDGGPRSLWQIVEKAHEQWHRLGEPRWERFGLSVSGLQHTVWLDHPDSSDRWVLPVTPE
jgi:protein-L-isoaspartate O-methyltransferase